MAPKKKAAVKKSANHRTKKHSATHFDHEHHNEVIAMMRGEHLGRTIHSKDGESVKCAKNETE